MLNLVPHGHSTFASVELDWFAGCIRAIQEAWDIRAEDAKRGDRLRMMVQFGISVACGKSALENDRNLEDQARILISRLSPMLDGDEKLLLDEDGFQWVAVDSVIIDIWIPVVYSCSVE